MMSKNGNVVVVSSLAAVSAFVAYLTYGVLDSTGASEQPGLSVGGAVVGFVVAFTLLAQLLKWLQRQDNDTALSGAQQEIRDLRAKNDQLSSQLIRSLTLPVGYVAEVLDHHKLVMARPEAFVSRGGVILDITAKNSDISDDLECLIDAVPPRLYVNYQPCEHGDPDKYYREYGERAASNPRFELMGLERTFIGLEERPLAALKVSTRSVAHVAITRDPFAEKYKLSSQFLKRSDWPPVDELDRGTVRVSSDELQDLAFERQVNVAMRSAMVVCLHPQLKQVFFFVFEDDETDFTEAVESLHCCLRSVRFLT